MSNENTIMLTDSEQDLYNSLTESQKIFFNVLRLRDKIERREMLSRLQDVTEAVRRVQEATEKMDKRFSALGKIWAAVKAGVSAMAGEWSKAKLE